MKKTLRGLLIAMLSLMVMIGMGSAVFADEGGAIADGTYQLNEIKSSLGMVGINTPATLEVNGEDAVLTMEVSKKAAERYSHIFIGSYADITEDTAGIEGIVTDTGLQFVIPMKTAQLASGQFNFVIRYKQGYSATHDGDWYKSSSGDDYYITLGQMTPVVTKTLVPTNNTGMFKAETASLVTVGDQTNLIMALSGKGYEYLYKGTYEDAVANKNQRENWIKGYKNAEDKWEFVIPVAPGETYIPIVSISASKLANFDEGKGDLEDAFYPRQLEINADAGTLVTGDYDHSFEISVTNNVSMFKPGEKATLRVIGGPNSNNYSALLTLPMQSDSYDQVKAVSYSFYNKELKEGDEVEIPLGEGSTFVEIPVLPAILGETVTLQFRSAKNQSYYKRDLTIDLAGAKAVFDPYAGDVVVKEIAALASVEEAKAYAAAHATPDFTDLLIEAIQVQKRDENTDKLCAAAKAAWDALTDEQKKEVDEADYFGLDTGDASADDPLNAAPDKEKELLVVSFGTSFNESRAMDIGGIEKALAAAYGEEYAVRRAFTAQIIINHIQARDGIAIDNMEQALQRAIDANVKELVIQPTHLMHGAEYDELCAAVEAVKDKFESVQICEPMLGQVGADATVINADKEAAAKAMVAEAVKTAGAESLEAMDQAGTAIVFMGHGTAHEASVTYNQMQAQMAALGYKNVFVGTVEGEPADTACDAVIEKVKAAGYKNVILRPMMVVAGDHANNDMADPEDEESWFSQFTASGNFESVTCQIEGLGRIADIQQIYTAHTKDIVSPAADQVLKINTQKKVVKAKKLKKKAVQTSAVAVEGAMTTITYAKVGGHKKLSINPTTGKIKVKKKTKKGVYKIEISVTAEATDAYKAAEATATIKVRVK